MTPHTDTLDVPDIVLDFSALDRLPTDKDLPSEDGVPMETNWHRAAMTLLIESIEYQWRDRTDFFVGGNMFIYFSAKQMFNKDFRGPDFFVVKDVPHDRGRLSWVTWKEGKFPDVVVELTSPTTAQVDRGDKKKLYSETFRTPEYFIYDPGTSTVEGWRRTNGGYHEPLEQEPGGRVWSKELELYLGPWDGVFLSQQARWPRFFDARNLLVPTFREAGQVEVNTANARAMTAELRAAAAEATANAEAAARTAAESEVERLKRELDALRQQLPPASP